MTQPAHSPARGFGGSLSVAPERLSTSEASYLYVERLEAAQHVGALAVVDGTLDYPTLLDDLERKVAAMPRFLDRIELEPLNLGHPRWCRDETFDIRNHVRHVVARGEDLDGSLRDITETVFSSQLDRGRPLWEIHLVSGLPEGKSALVSKVHLSLVENGLAGSLMSGVFDLSAKVDPKEATSPATDTARGGSTSSVVNALWDSWAQRVEQVGELREDLSSAARLAVGRLSDPSLVLREMRRSVASTRPLPFNRSCSGRRRLDWCELSYAEARAIRSSLGGTVNDVVLTILVRALARYATLHGQPVESRQVRILAPWKRRSTGRPGRSGFPLARPLELPLDVADPARLMKIINLENRQDREFGELATLRLAGKLAATTPPSVQALFAGSMPSRRASRSTTPAASTSPVRAFPSFCRATASVTTTRRCPSATASESGSASSATTSDSPWASVGTWRPATTSNASWRPSRSPRQSSRSQRESATSIPYRWRPRADLTGGVARHAATAPAIR